MAEKPILFSGPMIRAILDGRKMQTRRMVTKPRMTGGYLLDPDLWTPRRLGVWEAYHPDLCQMVEIACPHGAPGDLLWVRETWKIATGRITGDLGAAIRYRADNEMQPVTMPADKQMPLGLTWDRWRPSIHMPKWAARLWLRVTGVRVERVQAISEADARAEGIDSTGLTYLRDGAARDTFGRVWSGIYGQESWDANQWVWVVEFERAANPARAKGGEQS